MLRCGKACRTGDVSPVRVICGGTRIGLRVFSRVAKRVSFSVHRLLAVVVGALLTLTWCSSAPGIVGNDALPQADWISPNPPDEDARAGWFRKTFTAPPGLVRTILLGACAERMTVFINGERAGEISAAVPATSLDVTGRVRPGENVLAVHVQNSSGLAAVRLLLELASERGRQIWIASDSSWLAARAEEPGWVSTAFAPQQPWKTAVAHGEHGLERWGNAFAATKSVDAYNSWMLAKGGKRATDPGTVQAPAGFRVELLRSAEAGEGSWIAMAFDARGRLTIAREQRGLLRFTLGPANVEKVEVINDTLLECRGLLYAHGSLFVNANNSRELYRLRDADGDDQFEEDLLLLKTAGGVGHGRNQLTLGPDGLIYIVHGNDVELTPRVDPASPLRQLGEDALVPIPWGEQVGNPHARAPAGHILQTDSEGKTWRVIAGGLRNPLEVAFNADGEMFTYDADNERDIAAPWYRPTRILHLVPGGDYGWRSGTAKWPVHWPDTLPSVCDIGVGSPTAVEFGTRSRFPEKYRRALFAADWAYGRILAVHLEPDGASYRGSSEQFVSGRPLNVTDLTFGPDGAMYFMTGGRGTQSGLYRVTSTGAESDETGPERITTDALELRRVLEQLPAEESGGAVAKLWPHLGSTDRWIRHAARLALERQPLPVWRDRALTERDRAASLTALLALSRVGPPESREALLRRLASLPLHEVSEAQKIAAARIAALACIRMGEASAVELESLREQFEPLYPASTTALNHDLCRLLVFVKSPQVVERTCQLLASARRSEDLLHYLIHLRNVRDGWSPDARRVFFEALRRAEERDGAHEYVRALKNIRTEATAALSPTEREALASVIAPPSPVRPAAAVDTSKFRFVQSWTPGDFSGEDLARVGSIERGREAFAAAQCTQCHRAGAQPGGVVGPDLSSVAKRFNRRDLLDAILEPSKFVDDKFRLAVITTRGGAAFTGPIAHEDEQLVALDGGSAGDNLIELPKSTIATRKVSDVSPMPPGLLNILTKEQIADLLAFLESGGETN